MAKEEFGAGQPAWKKIELLNNELEANKGLRYPVDSKKWYDKDLDETERKKLWSAPYDARFPQQNQTNHCWFYYVDYHRCKNLKGEDYEPCNYLKQVYTCMCPPSWVEKWNNWMDEGRFPVRTDR